MRRVVVVEGEEVPYDFLLIATGPDTDGGSVPGLGGEFNFAHFVHTEGAALETSGGVERFLDNPGPAVVGLARGAAYLSPAYEFVLWLDYSLRRRGNRDRATLTFVTPEEHLGHLGVGTPRAQQHLERAFARRNISVYTSAEIERIGADHVDLHGGTQLPSVLTTVVPGFRGMAGIWKTSGLTDSLGYVPVDEYYRHRQYPEIYAAGVAADPEAIVAAHTSVPKTGYLATSMAKAAARSMAAAVTWTVPNARALPRVVDIRIVDGGDVGLLLLSIGRTRPLRLALSLPGRLSHYLKRALNRYVLWKLRTGRTYLP
jgi:sulfide:quinone oxidoreductase